MGQTAAKCNCCGNSVPHEEEISTEIRRNEPRRKHKPIASRKQTGYTTPNSKAPTLQQSLLTQEDNEYTKKQSYVTPESDNDEIKSNTYNNKITTNDSTDIKTEYVISDLFVKIDTALSIYYQNNGIDDYYMNNDKKMGRFSKYIMENKYDPNDIEYQLGDNINAKDCKYINFDYNNFPLNMNYDDRDEEIFKIIQYCYQYGEPPVIAMDENTATMIIHSDKMLNQIQNKSVTAIYDEEEDGMQVIQRMDEMESMHHDNENKANPDDYVNQITVYVIQGRNLPKYDTGPNAKSDPYVKVKIGRLQHAEFRTSTIRRELNPIWNAQFVEEGQALFGKIDEITFDVFDHDKISKDDFMGRCTLKTDHHPNNYYSTPIQWIPLVDDKNKPVFGKNGKRAAIQIKIKYTLNADDLNIRYYTHVMEFTVKRGKNIRNKEFIGKSDPYVKLEWGAQTYETRYVNNTDNPIWNETAFLFVHEELQSQYQLKLCVMDKDINQDDQLGTGYIAASEVFEKCRNEKVFNLDVNLRAIPVSLDRGLLDFEKDDKFKRWGDLEVEVRLKSKRKVEKEFYEQLVATFDKNNDGVIDKAEVSEMFAELKIPKDVDEFFNKFDENNDMKIDENEVVKMLQDSDFQGSELAIQLMAIYLNGDLKDDHQRHLMSGFTHKHSDTSKTIKIKDRETGLLVQEFIPSYVWYSLKLIYDVKLNRAMVQSKVAKKILYQMSKKRGIAMNSTKSAAEIAGFIRQHNLETKSLYKKPSDFKTFNDFFARGMNVDEYRPLANPNDENVIVSPADCRMMCFDSILDSTKFWIKGGQFTLENLVAKKINIKKYNGGSFVISRLAPQDYHRWHYPVSGKIINIEKIDGSLYTVNPIAINKSVDVYTENKRAIVEIQCNENIGNCIMFVIAATMVGSYILHRKEANDPTINNPLPLQIGDTVKRGDVAGEFRFGGSTILLLFEPNKIQFDQDIVHNVNTKFETLMTVRSRIGRVKS